MRIALSNTAPPVAVGLGGSSVISDNTLKQLPYSQRQDRLAGTNRYDTAVAIAGRAFPKAPSSVYLARGDTLADAVAAGVLTDGPVLLVRSACGKLPPSVAAYLSLVTPQEVIALGGKSSVCDDTLRVAAAAARPGQVPVVANVAESSGHTCAVTERGEAKCWGNNARGGLGDGTTTDRSTPVTVVGLGRGSARSVAAGRWFSCALTVEGAVKCWGDDSHSQLGDEARPFSTSAVPIDIPRLGAGTTAAVVAGQKHVCAVSILGATRCWGSNSSSQLGIGMAKGGQEGLPTLVTGLGAGMTKQIDGAYLSTCGVRTDGAALCWGSNYIGQLGDGTDDERNRPTPVSGLGPGSTTYISAGVSNGCAVTRAGAAKCWGEGSAGALGTGTTPREVLTPVDVVGMGPGSTAAIDTAGSGFTCALTQLGAAKCWGSNAYANLGIGPKSGPFLTPQQVLGLTEGTTTQVSIGYRHTCAVGAGSEVQCWGDNSNGQLGDGTYEERGVPARVAL